MRIGFLGYGVFGEAIGSLIEKNGHEFETVDLGQAFAEPIDVVFLAVPVQNLRVALKEHVNGLFNVKLVVNLSKGIEKETGYLPHQIAKEILGEHSYVAVSGPSFASEILAEVPTTVSIAGTDDESVVTVSKLLSRPHFVLEILGTVLELELAGAMKNIYALAAGYVAGSGGGRNTIAHVQVVALREYTKLVHALEGNSEVVRPGVVGDLFLTTGSKESRNFQYGDALARLEKRDDLTAEGVVTAESVTHLAKGLNVELPLANATCLLIEQSEEAHVLFYQALGFNHLNQTIT